MTVSRVIISDDPRKTQVILKDGRTISGGFDNLPFTWND